MDAVLFVELEDLRPTDLLAMRRHEVVEHAVQVRDGALVQVRDHYVLPDWDDAKRREICHRVAECRDGGGAAWGARVDDVLVALAAVDARPVGGDGGVVSLDLLHVSAPWRGRGFARTLTERAAAFAQSVGAHTLYVSASNSERTVAVYRRFGAVVADSPDPAWFAREPLDVHLRLPLPLANPRGATP
ncbi:MAG TPA: GNAT family N-acetyltransferase [Ornithinibacter sp.]|nr:GNAT family N-acetyltransferase [Ornithinibacter sp.]